MTWAVSAPVESSGQRLVLLMLANHCNSHTGQCNPSHKLLAAECCMGVSTLKMHIKRLEEIGALSIIHKAMDGVCLPNQYILNMFYTGQKSAHEPPAIHEGVGQKLAEGGSESGRGVGQNLATNQEVKPGIKPDSVLVKNSEPENKPFSLFWAAFPNCQRKGAKSKAANIWKTKRLDTQQGQIMAYLEAMAASEQWTKNGGAFIPAPVAFLNAAAWDGWAGFDDSNAGPSGGLGIGAGGI